MKNIYTGIDIGSDAIKIVVSEVDKNKFNILASSQIKSAGVKKGLIINADEAIESLKDAIKDIEVMLGLKINKAIFTVPSYNAHFDKVIGYSTITNDEKTVNGSDIVRCLQGAVYNKIPTNFELVNVIPIDFNLDGKVGIRDPKGLVGAKLGVKAHMVAIPKKNVAELTNVAEACGIEVVDITIGAVGDYQEFKTTDTDGYLGAIINIGDQKTEVSLFNKGILVQNEVIEIGSNNIDKDIDFVYKIGLDKARELKEKFVVAHKRYASVHDIFDCVNKNEEKLSINQFEMSEVVMSRLAEILKLAKKQINLLTNHKISYIIITGGVSSIPGFKYLVNEIYGRYASVGKIQTIGIRHNKFSSCIGSIKYFAEKLNLRGKVYSMLTDENESELVSTKKRIVDENSWLGKIIGYFFESN